MPASVLLDEILWPSTGSNSLDLKGSDQNQLDANLMEIAAAKNGSKGEWRSCAT